MTNGTQLLQNQRGVVLIEVMVAALIFAIGILAVIGLQAAAIANVADAKYRVDASMVANRLLGSVWANQTTAATSSGAVSELPNGSYVQTLTAITEPLDASTKIGYAANVTVTWQPPNATAVHTFNAVASVYKK